MFYWKLLKFHIRTIYLMKMVSYFHLFHKISSTLRCTKVNNFLLSSLISKSNFERVWFIFTWKYFCSGDITTTSELSKFHLLDQFGERPNYIWNFCFKFLDKFEERKENFALKMWYTLRFITLTAIKINH